MRSLRTFFFALVILSSSAVVRATAEPTAALRVAVEDVLAIAYDGSASAQPLSERVRPTLEQTFNFESITRRAIGPGWRQFSPEQQKRAVSLFTTVVIRNYADRFEIGARPGITYKTPVSLSPGKTEIPTTIDYEGKKYAVAYRLEQAAGGWRIYDVIIEGVSMIASYRSQLDAVNQRGGADAVLKALAENLTPAAPAVTSDK
jgi:phospholipid transport system substrate-binding protein